MLKRNGEDCEFPVPNYPGLLTASERIAYQMTIPVVAAQLRLFDERAKTLVEIEKQSPQIAEAITAQVTGELASLIVQEGQVSTWQVRQTLFKSARSETLLCSRDLAGKQQFGVIEKFEPQSPYARIHGETDLQMTGGNIFLLLQNYVAREREVLQLFRKDIEATVEENLAEKFPGQNHTRVVRAISARCQEQTPVEGEQQKPSTSIKIRM